MKYLLIAATLFLQSCATYIGLTYDQKCANKGMVLAGANEDTTYGSQYNYNYGLTTARYSSDSVSCRVPANNEERKLVSLEQERLQPINEYNNGYNGKYWLNVLGYYAFILPGVGLKFYFDGQQADAIQKYYEIGREQNNRNVSSSDKP